jgi:hypothetical protein
MLRKTLQKIVYAAGLVVGCILLPVLAVVDLVRPGSTGRCNEWIKRRLNEKDKGRI